MSDAYVFNSITITTLEERNQNQIEFSVLHTEAGVKETVAFSVLVPLAQSRTILEFQKVGAERAIELLQNVLLQESPVAPAS